MSEKGFFYTFRKWGALTPLALWEMPVISTHVFDRIYGATGLMWNDPKAYQDGFITNPQVYYGLEAAPLAALGIVYVGTKALSMVSDWFRPEKSDDDL